MKYAIIALICLPCLSPAQDLNFTKLVQSDFFSSLTTPSDDYAPQLSLHENAKLACNSQEPARISKIQYMNVANSAHTFFIQALYNCQFIADPCSACFGQPKPDNFCVNTCHCPPRSAFCGAW